MFRASSAHLQEHIVVYVQHMVPSLSIRVLVACWYAASCLSTGHQELWRYHMLLVYNYVLLKMSTWCSKHVEESSILWINNNQCIKLVIKVQSRQSVFTARYGLDWLSWSRLEICYKKQREKCESLVRTILKEIRLISHMC